MSASRRLLGLSDDGGMMTVEHEVLDSDIWLLGTPTLTDPQRDR